MSKRRGEDAGQEPVFSRPAGIAAVAVLVGLLAGPGMAAEGDRATHDSDHDEDAVILPPVHVHGIPLNKDQQLGPVPTHTPWPTIPAVLEGKVIDDWMKARLLVSRDATVEVVVLEPCKHRELTGAGLAALKQWAFDPQMRGDEPIDGELTVRIHFRTQ
ncbi:MAG: energy transducer TonB family protein [Nitrospiraceae bacterium]